MKAALHTRHYDTAIQVSDAEFAQLQLTPHDFHGDWNYTIRPTTIRRHKPVIH